MAATDDVGAHGSAVCRVVREVVVVLEAALGLFEAGDYPIADAIAGVDGLGRAKTSQLGIRILVVLGAKGVVEDHDRSVRVEGSEP